MGDLLNVAQMDLSNLTEFQKALHEPNANQPDEEIDSRFEGEIVKISWTTDIYSELTSVPEGKFTVYRIDPNYHVLRYTVLRTKLLGLRVKEQFKGKVQICWPPNLLVTMIKSCSLCVNDEPGESYDDIFFNMWLHQLFTDKKAGAREAVYESIGNFDFLTEWSDVLPEYPLQFKIPWSYSKSDLKALPIFRSAKTPLKHKFAFKLGLNELLRMRLFDSSENVWKEVDFTADFIEGAPSNYCLPTPTLWGKYGQMTDDERNERLKARPVYSLYIDDVVSWDTADTKTYGMPINVPLGSADPCKFIGWVAENMDASRRRLYGNFTTNAENPRKGWNPFGTFKLTYGVSSERVPELESDHSDRIFPICDFPSCPFLPGFNGIAFAGDLGSLDADIAQSFKKLNAELILNLKNTDPFLNPINSGGENKSTLTPEEIIARSKRPDNNGPPFRIHVRCLVVKKLVFEKDECRIVAESKRRQTR